MFAKLLKHEWRACRGDLGLYTLGALGVGLIASLDLRFLIRYSYDLDTASNPFVPLLQMSLTLMLVFAVIALAVYAVGMQVLLLYRFYKNKFTDEGYLTFTLPVTAPQIFWSSFLNIAIWSLISMVTVSLAAGMILLLGVGTDVLEDSGVQEALQKLWEAIRSISWSQLAGEIYEMDATAIVVLESISAVITPFRALIMPMACLTAGATLAKKHKILAAVGSYYVLTMVESLAGSAASVLPNVFFGGIANSYEYTMGYWTSMSAVDLLVNLGMTLGCYFLSVYLMKRKLNLP